MARGSRVASARSTAGFANRSRASTVPDDARALGELLHDHVRFEERQLFALLEARLSEPELARLGAAIEREERR